MAAAKTVGITGQPGQISGVIEASAPAGNTVRLLQRNNIGILSHQHFGGAVEIGPDRCLWNQHLVHAGAAPMGEIQRNHRQGIAERRRNGTLKQQKGDKVTAEPLTSPPKSRVPIPRETAYPYPTRMLIRPVLRLFPMPGSGNCPQIR